MCIVFGGEKGTSVLSPAIPLALVVVPAYIIACKSESHIFEQHPCLYILAFGIVTAKVTNRLVVTVAPPIANSNCTLVAFSFHI